MGSKWEVVGRARRSASWESAARRTRVERGGDREGERSEGGGGVGRAYPDKPSGAEWWAEERMGEEKVARDYK